MATHLGHAANHRMMKCKKATRLTHATKFIFSHVGYPFILQPVWVTNTSNNDAVKDRMVGNDGIT